MARFPRAARDAAHLPPPDDVDLEDQLAALSLSSRTVDTPGPSSATATGSEDADDSDDESAALAEKITGKAAIHANILSFFETTYGTQEGKLEAWQKLCEHVGVEAGPSITKCKKVMLAIPPPPPKILEC